MSDTIGVMLWVDRRWVTAGGLVLAACPAEEAPEPQDSQGDTAASETGDPDPEPGTTGIIPDDSGGDSSSGGSSDGSLESTGDSSGSTGGSVVDDGCAECLVLATGLDSGRGIAVNDTHVFWTDEAAGTIHRIAKGGGDGMVIVDDAGTPYELALDDEHVYWTSNTSNGGVLRAPLDGGDPELIAEGDNPRTLDLTLGLIYWGDYDGNEGNVWRASVNPITSPELVASFFGGGVSDLVATEGSVFVSTHTETTDVSFIQPPPDGPPVGSITELTVGPGQPQPMQIIAGMAQPWGLALSGDTLVWANGDGVSRNAPNSIQSAQVGGGATQLASSQTAPWGVAADADFAYWTDFDTVKAVALDGGQPEVLATQQNSARYITVDESFVYWVTADRVLQRPKP